MFFLVEMNVLAYFDNHLSKAMIVITGEQLCQLRQIRNLKQQVLADALDMRQQGYSKIEKLDKVPADKLQKLLPALNLTMEEALKILNILYPPPPIKVNARTHTTKYKRRGYTLTATMHKPFVRPTFIR